MDINIKELFELIANRINNPVNVKLPVKAIVKEIPDSRHGKLLTLVLYDMTDEANMGIDERIIDDEDLYENKIIVDEDLEEALG